MICHESLNTVAFLASILGPGRSCFKHSEPCHLGLVKIFPRVVVYHLSFLSLTAADHSLPSAQHQSHVDKFPLLCMVSSLSHTTHTLSISLFLSSFSSFCPLPSFFLPLSLCPSLLTKFSLGFPLAPSWVSAAAAASHVWRTG